MMENNYNIAAFPLADTADGMTLLDYFAAKAMMAEMNEGIPSKDTLRESVAKFAYMQAAAMLEARKEYIK